MKQRDERRIVGSNSGAPAGIMGGVGLQGHAMFSTRREFNVQVCGCQPELIFNYAYAHKYYCLLQKAAPALWDSSGVLIVVLQDQWLFSD